MALIREIQPNNRPIAIYTPGQECGFTGCVFCESARSNVQTVQTLEPAHVEVFAAKLGFVREVRIAGQCGDFFAIKDFDRREVLQAMKQSLHPGDNRVLRDAHEIRGISIITNGLSITKEKIENISDLLSSVDIVLSIDLAHHDASGCCKVSYPSMKQLIEQGHMQSCLYFSRIQATISLLKEYLPLGKIAINNCGPSGTDSSERKYVTEALAQYLGTRPSNCFVSQPYYPSHDDRDKPQSKVPEGLNNGLIFIDVREGQEQTQGPVPVSVYFYYTFRNLLNHQPDAWIEM